MNEAVLHKHGALIALAQAVEEADPRIKILAAMVFGLLALRASVAGLLAFAAPLALLLWALSAAKPLNRSMTKAYVFFVAVWMVVKFGLDLWTGLAWRDAAITSGELGLRLAVLILIGLALAQATSPRSLGLGLAAMLRPVLRQRAWRAALSMALFVHFLPLVWQSINTVRKAFTVRGLRLPWHRRMLLLTQSLLRHWSQKAWKQTLALATRGLDGPEAWDADLPFEARQWLAGLAAACAGAALLLA